MTVLYPTIPEIEARWFEPSDELLSRIAAGDGNVPEELKEAVENDPDLAAFVEALRNPESEEFDASDSNGTVPEKTSELVGPPEWMMELVTQKYAAHRKYRNTQPDPGCIVSVDRLIGPAGELPVDFNGPIAVTLDAKEESADVWYGWITATETDYATDWDFVVQEDDGDFDPCLVGIIQLWNPVRVYSKSMARVIGKLKPGRLLAARALVAEFVTRSVARETPALPGSIGLRTTLNDLIVVTGTPLAGPTDPRWRYQEIYHAIAETVRKPARLAMAARPMWKILLERIMSAIRENPMFELKFNPALNECTLGYPNKALLQAASGNDDLLKFRIEPGGEKTHIRLIVTSCTSDPFWLDIVDSDKNDTQSLSFNGITETKEAILVVYGSTLFRIRDQHGQSQDFYPAPIKPEN